jgi:MFS family permease
MLDLGFFRDRRFSAAGATITLVFFALFGFVFLSTQYLQFVLGYSPFAAGLRTLPFAAAMIVTAPMSTKLVERLGTKWVVVGGMLIFSSGLVIASTVAATSGYPRLGLAMLLLGAGLGLASAPATESVMGSLPANRAGVGSAVNDTAREVGGALGVAIVGSVVASIYRRHLAGGLPPGLPAEAAATAHDSLGAALQVSTQIGPSGSQLAGTARAAFVEAMSRASVVTAGIAALGALVAWRYLPARAAAETTDERLHPTSTRTPWYIGACACTYGYARPCHCPATDEHAQASCACDGSSNSAGGSPTDLIAAGHVRLAPADG